MTRLKHIFAALPLVVFIGLSSTASAAPSSDLWDRWSRHDADSTRTIDHKPWDMLLGRFVIRSQDGINRFSYAQFRRPQQQQLDTYIQAMSQLPISRYNRDQQRAYWINLYNALTVAVVVQNFPVQSIKDITSGFFSPGPWKQELIEIEGERLTLDDIEHRILRPIWKDPRIHYAVNCAAIGCPNLQPAAFSAANSENLLEQAAVEFINHPRSARIVDGKLQVSSIYVWFSEDFGDSDRGVISHLRQYADDDLKLALVGVNEIDNDSYDWNINSADKPEKPQSTRRRGS